MSAFFQGIVVGLTFAALLGPGFFALLQTSIHRGFRAGMCLSIGIFLSDVFVLLLCYFGISHFLESDPRHNAWFQIVGGLVLTSLGFYTFNIITGKTSAGGTELNFPCMNVEKKRI